MSVYTLIALLVVLAVLLTVMASFSQRRRMRPEYARARDVARRAAQARSHGRTDAPRGER